MDTLTPRQTARLQHLRAEIDAAALRAAAKARTAFAVELRRLLSSGHSLAELGRALGVSKQAVHDVLRRAEAEEPPAVARADL
jgi:DNA invertase Pin-like site-specific DNA recombinase